jgi:hypothetical protein
MKIIQPGAHAWFRESEIIYRFQLQRADELRHLYGLAYLIRRFRIYWWARDMAIPEIIADRERRQQERSARRHWL